MAKKTLIPVAYIFTDVVPDHFAKSYATTFYEEFTFTQALNADPNNLQNLYNCANVVRYSRMEIPKNKIFAIYNPSKNKVLMSQVIDGDNLKVLVDTVEKQKLLSIYMSDFEKWETIADSLEQFYQQYQFTHALKNRPSTNIASSKKIISKNNDSTILNLKLIHENLVNGFKNDLCI